jgi:Membrane protein involved in the export of O-antigen and teichoic acid
MPSRDTVISNLFWKFSERVSTQLASFIISIVLARILLPEDFGVVAILMVLILISDVFVVSGFSTALIQKKDADDIDFSTIFWCSLGVSLLIYVLFYFAAPFIASFYNQPILAPLLRVFALKVPVSAFNSIQHAYASRHMLFRRFFYSTLSGTFVSGIIGVAIAYNSGGAWALVAQYISCAIVDSIVLLFTISWRPQCVFSVSAAKKLVAYGWKVLAADLMGTFFEQLRTLLIGKTYNASQLAYYNRGQSFPSMFSDNVTTSIMAVLFPALSNHSDNVDVVKQMVRRAVRIISFVVFPLLGGCAIVAKPLVHMLLTKKWEECIPFIQVLCVSQAVSMIGATSIQSIKAIGRSDILLKIEIIKKPIFIILLIIGMKISVLAVAVTGLIYSFYATFVNANTLKKLIYYSFREQILDLYPATICTLIMALLCTGTLYLSISDYMILCIQMLVGVISYWIMSIITKNDSYLYLKDYVTAKIKK